MTDDLTLVKKYLRYPDIKYLPIISEPLLKLIDENGQRYINLIGVRINREKQLKAFTIFINGGETITKIAKGCDRITAVVRSWFRHIYSYLYRHDAKKLIESSADKILPYAKLSISRKERREEIYKAKQIKIVIERQIRENVIKAEQECLLIEVKRKNLRHAEFWKDKIINAIKEIEGLNLEKLHQDLIKELDEVNTLISKLKEGEKK